MRFLGSKRASPIGIDLGSRALKLAQLDCSGESPRVLALAQHALPLASEAPNERIDAIRQGLTDLLRSGLFYGRDAVLSLNPQQLFIQNVRLPRLPDDEMTKVVRWEAEERLPEDFGDAEVRHLVAGDVRNPTAAGEGSEVRREVILLACRRKELNELIDLLDSLRLRPLAIDAPACALARTTQTFLRRKADEQTPFLFIDVGAGVSTVVVTRGPEILLIKPLPISGLSMDKLVARRLKLSVEDAAQARRHWAGGTESGTIDLDLARAVGDAVRSEVEALAGELVMCIRYHSVTFRGNRIAKAILMGGEGNARFAEQLAARIDTPCDLGDPFLGLSLADCAEEQLKNSRPGQWAVALGLCLGTQRHQAA
jgi:type IV pilus assembly protein PilM